MIFFKKPFIKDLLEGIKVDIHSHVLFGIDDGAKTKEDSFKLISSLQAYGYQKLIATPHIIKNQWDNDSNTISKSLIETQGYLREKEINIELHAAAEYMMDHYFVEAMNESPLMCLKDNFILVEMSYINPPIQLFDIIYQIKLNGFVPVLAHPERYVFYHNNLRNYKKLKDAGCYFQSNIPSLVGYYGTHISKATDFLLKNNLIDFLSTDAHHMNHINIFEKRIKVNQWKKIKSLVEKTNDFFL